MNKVHGYVYVLWPIGVMVGMMLFLLCLWSIMLLWMLLSCLTWWDVCVCMNWEWLCYCGYICGGLCGDVVVEYVVWCCGHGMGLCDCCRRLV